MEKIPNKLLILGAVAAAALVVPGVLGPLVLEEAYAQTARASNRATDNVVNVQAAVAVQDALNENDVTVCIIADTCR
jgi:hypothetical protein